MSLVNDINQQRLSLAAEESLGNLNKLNVRQQHVNRLSAPPAMEVTGLEDNKPDRLVLNKFILYETKTNYYIVGSNLSDNRFRFLKIDRTSPNELNVIEDDGIYSKQEINDILAVLEEGNRVSGGLKTIVTAYGIVEGYYISLITKRSVVALIGGHYIYHIDETLLRPIGSQNKPEKNSDEYKYIGARFLKRGVNDQGYVANDVETEQIVSEMSTTSFHRSGTRLYDNPHYTSYVQHRGSIPLFWSQDTNMSPKPPIMINFRDPFYSAAALHYDNMFKRYGAPIIVLNLIKTKEKNPRESILGDEFEETMKYLTQFLPENCLRYQAWDMSKARKSDDDVMELMEGFAEEYLAATGFFHSGPEAFINVLRKEETQGKPQTRRMSFRQNGVVRTNCIDCLDRTNAAQLIIGKCALGHQLYALGIIDEPRVPVDSDVVNMLTDMYHDHGDTIAFQYGGSNLVNTIDSYRKINQWTSHSRDLIENIRRYYNNAFADADKQDAINLFLGNFVPQKDRPHLWELPSDYFLHNGDPRFKRPRRSYIKWWTNEALLPREDQEQDSARYRLVPRLARQFDDECDPFAGYWVEYYRPRLFTSFDKLFAINMNKYVRRANLPNPITDIRTQAADEMMYEDCLDIPKRYAMMQAVGSNQHGGAKSRYQAYDAWLRTGKLMSNSKSSESRSKISEKSAKNETYRKKFRESQIKEQIREIV
ncbi:1127_t:CDS:10 [Acaulospora colombiana]|uniref:1127_t:CDS:1 n=1 Tax=Acaulospora colombiana TaxID=27376 RepID=A0ACA9KZX5_9GLOM|nr:1127_t:CDS:10 [Acaulospora colombiana]